MADNSQDQAGAPISEIAEHAEGTDAQTNDDILEVARKRLAIAEEAESDIRSLALEDLEFRAGDQWPENIKQDRSRDARPCLVINRLPQFVQQITNDQRQNRPAIKVHPIDSAATVETAKVIQGLIRHIEYNSNAEVAYDTATESAVIGGFGYFRIITDFVSPDSFEQEIYIKRIRNPFSVFFDPYAQEPDGSDANWAFITDELSKDEFKAAFPGSEISQDAFDWKSVGNQAPSWFPDGGVRIAEYFYKELVPTQVHLLSTGETVTDADLPHHAQAAAQSGLPVSIVKSRIAKIPVIKWCKLNGVEILESGEFPGSYIPIIPVYGAELFVNGKRILEGVVRNAKDPQRMLNYWKSAETEAIALAPRAPFIGAEGQFEGHESEWKSANRRNHAYLEYKPTTIAGQMAPPPQRQAFEPAVQAITQASMGAADDLKAVTGIYDAAVGAAGNETSGVAIQNRGRQSQVSNYHFVDNLTRSLKHAGRIIVEILPKIYDTARAARIIGEDGAQSVVMLNSNTKDDSGKDVIYSLDQGRYDVTVDVGPSFASKRQETAAAMVEVARAYPQIMQIAGDLFVKNQDWPGAQEIAERLKIMLPPQLQDQKAQQVPPQIQAQMQQLITKMEQLDKENNELTKIIETKSLELQHKERVEAWNVQLKDKELAINAEIAMLKAGSNEAIALLQQQVSAIQHQGEMMNARLKLLGINQPIEAPQDFNPQQADGGNYPGAGHVGSGPTGGPMSPGQTLGDNP